MRRLYTAVVEVSLFMLSTIRAFPSVPSRPHMGQSQPPGSQEVTRGNWGPIIEAARKAVVVIKTERGQGSGFVIESNGTIVTNAHVIEGATSIQVKLSTGEIYPRAYVLASDDIEDVAILRIEAANLSSLQMANSSEVKVGDEVLLVGAPLGLEQTVSTGLVSAVRVTEKGIRVLQTTAAASPGSSGGPLLSTTGQAIGILSFGAIEGQNLNFAIAINYVRGKLDALPLSANRLLQGPSPGSASDRPSAGGIVIAGFGTPAASFQYVFLELMNYLASRGVNVANETATIKPMQGEIVSLNYYLARLPKSGFEGLLYVTVDHGSGQIHRITLQCYDKAGKLLWQEKSSSTWSWAMTELGSAKAATEQLEKKIAPKIGKEGLPLKRD